MTVEFVLSPAFLLSVVSLLLMLNFGVITLLLGLVSHQLTIARQQYYEQRNQLTPAPKFVCRKCKAHRRVSPGRNNDRTPAALADEETDEDDEESDPA